MPKWLLTTIAVLLASPAVAGEETFHDVDGGWHEAWIGVSDLPRMQRFFEEVAGWSLVKKGRIDQRMLTYLAPDATGGAYALLRADDYPQGWVRLIDIRGAERKIIRSNAQSWDTGGVFSIMTRSADIARNLKDAERLGWTAYNDPYDFGFGSLKLRNVVLRGPDGVNVAIYEWVEPKRIDAPPPGAVSKAFNSMQMVADIDKALRFYVDGLGFRIIQRGTFVDPVETPTNFALPVNYATKIARKYAILIPKDGNDEAGRIELMEFDGFEGRILAAQARPHDLGVASLLFPVSDLDIISARLHAIEAPIVRASALIDLPPFGEARALTTSSPDGVLLTYFQSVGD